MCRKNCCTRKIRHTTIISRHLVSFSRYLDSHTPTNVYFRPFLKWRHLFHRRASFSRWTTVLGVQRHRRTVHERVHCCRWAWRPWSASRSCCSSSSWWSSTCRATSSTAAASPWSSARDCAASLRRSARRRLPRRAKGIYDSYHLIILYYAIWGSTKVKIQVRNKNIQNTEL